MPTSGPGSSSPSLSVVLAHRYRLVGEGIASILREAGFRVLGQTDTVEDLFQLAEKDQPDLILLDWELPDSDAEAVRILVKAVPSAAIVIITRPTREEKFLQALNEGASGYLSVTMSSQDFVQILPMLAQGDFMVSKEMLEHIKNELVAEQAADVLSDREREVLSLVGQGATNREIADVLVITANTVKVHLRNILHKLDLRNRQQAAGYAVRQGITP